MRFFTFIRCFALVMALLCLLKTGNAQQLALTWPKDGAVFQQDPNGKSNLVFMGYFSSKSFKLGRYTVTATLEKLNLQTGNPEGVVRTMNVTPGRLGTIFGYTMADVDKGWYRLTVSGVSTFAGSTLPVFTNSVKVGVGEVFIIAGQSNAQGLPNTANEYMVAEPANGQNYVYDGVRLHTETNGAAAAALAAIGNPSNIPLLNRLTYLDKIAPYKSVVQASADLGAGIGPTGSSLWYWARLGEQIAQAKGVPVAF